MNSPYFCSVQPIATLASNYPKQQQEKQPSQPLSQQQQQQQQSLSILPYSLPYDEGQMLCTHSPVSYNVSLKGGTESGNFTDLGGVETMDLCISLCCEIA